jgi:protein SCO1/2
MIKFYIGREWVKSGYFWLGIFIVLLAVGGFFLVALTRPYNYHGTLITPPKIAPDFSMTDVQGQSFSLGSQKGKITLLFFGYTNCTDECPTTLAIVNQAISNLGEKASQVVFVFVTVDPERDTAAVLRAYLAKFNPAFIGLTASLPDMQPIWNDYGVYVTKVAGTNPDNYSVTHSLSLYLINQQGYLTIVYPYGTQPNDISNDLMHLLK